MILGYPGRTERYLSSYGVNYNLTNIYPVRIKIRRKKLDIMEAHMKKSEQVRIQYSSKYARVSNYWKNFIGMSRGLKRLHVAEKKKAIEKRMTKWIDAYPSRKENYGTMLSDIQKAYEEMSKYSTERYYYYEAVYYGIESLGLAAKTKALYEELLKENPDKKAVDKIVTRLRKYSDKFFKDYDYFTDKELFAKLLAMYKQDVPFDQQPPLFVEYGKKFGNNFQKMADKLYPKSVFTSKERYNAFLDNPQLKSIGKDRLFHLAVDFVSTHGKVNKKMNAAREKLKRGHRLYIDVLRKMDSNKKFYPDANFTMRLTYGQVEDYYPADGVHYRYYTTLKGIMEKEDPGNPEFTVPKKLKEIYESKDYGLYGEGDVMKVCFLTNNDITGGNSGSPVINGKGELIGLAFDGNWEAMSGDIVFEPELQRTICVDIRYVLLIIDKFAGATNLIDELKLVGSRIE